MTKPESRHFRVASMILGAITKPPPVLLQVFAQKYRLDPANILAFYAIADKTSNERRLAVNFVTHDRTSWFWYTFDWYPKRPTEIDSANTAKFTNLGGLLDFISRYKLLSASVVDQLSEHGVAPEMNESRPGEMIPEDYHS